MPQEVEDIQKGIHNVQEKARKKTSEVGIPWFDWLIYALVTTYFSGIEAEGRGRASKEGRGGGKEESGRREEKEKRR